MPKTKVRYIGATQDQINWGGNDDPRKLLKIGEVYEVYTREVHTQHTKISLLIFPALKFNSASFEGVK